MVRRVEQLRSVAEALVLEGQHVLVLAQMQGEWADVLALAAARERTGPLIISEADAWAEMEQELAAGIHTHPVRHVVNERDNVDLAGRLEDLVADMVDAVQVTLVVEPFPDSLAPLEELSARYGIDILIPAA